MTEELKIQFKDALNKGLPGEKAHREMMSYKRQLVGKDFLNHPTAKKGGVLCLIYVEQGMLHIPLMLRVSYPGVHSNQISFPGGKMEPHDEDIVQTAEREAEEELGILPKQYEKIGTLSQVYIPPSNFLVTPVLAVAHEKPKITIDPREVKEPIAFSVETMLNEQYTVVKKLYIPHMKMYIHAPAFLHGDKIIWGATAMILNEIKHLIKDNNLKIK